jgi:(p)ppGpp synthase/HD superfamily hydrolase
MNTIGIRFARYYAAVKHAGQQYSGGLPYTHHLAAVEAVLRRFGYGTNRLTGFDNVDEHEALLQASWLHDVVEDQGVKLREIKELFGTVVAGLVDAVTNGPGENRKARQIVTYPKIRATPNAINLKLADRIANVEHGGSVDMYRKEYEDFRRALYTPGTCDEMWAHLDNLLKG